MPAELAFGRTPVKPDVETLYRRFAKRIWSCGVKSGDASSLEEVAHVFLIYLPF